MYLHTYRPRQDHYVLSLYGLLLGTLTAGGCGANLGGDNTQSPPSTLSLSVVDANAPGDTFREATANDLMADAEFVEATAQPITILGNIAGSNDVDVYDLGPVDVGDRVIVNMTPASSLNGAIALFDDDGSSLLINDHRNVYLGTVRPFIDLVIQRESPSCFVAVASTPGFGSSGDYTLVASKQPVNELPDLHPDTMLLIFDGSDGVRIGGRSAVDVPPFDATDISSSYAGDTNEMIEQIVARVRRDYAPYDVLILSTSEGDTFEEGMSRIFFGAYDSALLGVAEGVDEFNGTRAQEAIVFTDTFAAFSQLSPSVAEMAQALANVASHEIGHLLGMIHTSDPTGIMDVTASLNELLRDQFFTRSPIYTGVFPIGSQDAAAYLLDTVGGDETLLPVVERSPEAVGLKIAASVRDVSARGALKLSTCCTGEN